MKKIASIIVIALAILCSCQSREKKPSDFVEFEDNTFDNPLDSIINVARMDSRKEEVYGYLSSHPDFFSSTKNVNYPLWRDCGKIRVYSIPLVSIYTIPYFNIVQYEGVKGVVDTLSLNNVDEHLNDMFEIKSKDGKTYYLLLTDQYVEHQGTFLREAVYAFSLENNRLVKEELFHAKNGQYDHIEVNCGGQRYCPLDYDAISLIQVMDVDDTDSTPSVIFALINENDWPTGYGLKYQWDGSCFQYVGKYKYDANGYFYY